ncbi:hypothetical protein HZH66_007558 [Vespula vulgaris]|uniref:Uncharacterized protein n=1 Tax=Vespula vulgaris TaxID=7454 RepID=A0A834JYF2_VESVU|nr:hypothetical protein HZH66_007558 [Vespula vulgaris]
MAGNGWHVIGGIERNPIHSSVGRRPKFLVTLFCEQYVSKVGVKFHVGPCRLLSEVGGTLAKRVLAAWLSGLSKALNSLQVSSQQNNVVPSVNLAAVLHGKFS